MMQTPPSSPPPCPPWIQCHSTLPTVLLTTPFHKCSAQDQSNLPGVSRFQLLSLTLLKLGGPSGTAFSLLLHPPRSLNPAHPSHPSSGASSYRKSAMSPAAVHYIYLPQTCQLISAPPSRPRSPFRNFLFFLRKFQYSSKSQLLRKNNEENQEKYHILL